MCRLTTCWRIPEFSLRRAARGGANCSHLSTHPRGSAPERGRLQGADMSKECAYFDGRGLTVQKQLKETGA